MILMDLNTISIIWPSKSCGNTSISLSVIGKTVIPLPECLLPFLELYLPSLFWLLDQAQPNTQLKQVRQANCSLLILRLVKPDPRLEQGRLSDMKVRGREGERVRERARLDSGTGEKKPPETQGEGPSPSP